jgi:hypothetical protein
MPSLTVLFDSSRMAMQSRSCPRCLGAMVVRRIKPSRIEFESRRPEGANCDHLDRVVTETHSLRWVSSKVRAPV